MTVGTGPLDTAELSAVASKATQHPWKLWGMQVLADPVGDSNLDDAIPIADTADRRYDKPRTFNARHIATFDPPTVLALLDEIDRLRSLLRTAASGR